jgi:hypothetical protein
MALIMQIPRVILVALHRGHNSQDASAARCSRGRLGLAHPGFLGKPFMLGPTNRAVNACEKDRGRVEAFAIGNDAGWDMVSRLWAFDHDDAH